MIQRLYTFEATGFEPYENMALEKRMFDTVGEGELILYLWQNRRTVVCGRNQNMYKECRVSRLLEDGGYPSRRLSGGGAVFHDMGNLNFTFLMRDEDYDVPRQLSVIIHACEMLGIHAEKTGRNDVTVDMKKFSGNAFHSSNGRRYHHGTLMVDVDRELLENYLNVDKEKLRSKGVDSVRSRVCNLKEYCPTLTIERLKEVLIQALEEVYALKSEPLELPRDEEHARLRSFFASDQWLYGRMGSFGMQINRRFAWGDFDLRFDVEQGTVKDAVVYSDANDAEYIAAISDSLCGKRFAADELCALVRAFVDTEDRKTMAEDICSLLKETM